MAATGGRRMDEARWTWDLEPNHSIDVTVGDAGLSYYGEDWNSLSGGRYFAGFQSFADFRRDGPLKGMPPEVAAEVRRVVDVAEGGGLDFVIVVDGRLLFQCFSSLMMGFANPPQRLFASVASSA